ncbi:NADP-dependent oxidoreductase [Granulosicoccus antarcticus]|uniref:2-haloacrylate reductase n=1 Tax=Granulosicoccus antarcticus IMCC3135 TaxID=1192854 RepID=A0A2Z2P4V9_9GAMM|nr:NADP-dependent oxidoreductase [Granulosicoccus antarcticus]ASJ75717.1 2-haloacrylate reductase [Granulosicoccus antarcticus IMCC3135]
MKAIIIEQAGGVENLLMSEQPKPAISDSEVLVATRALGINPADTKVKYDNEALTQLFGEERPMILGWDIAGTVVETGSKVSKFKVGDRVFGMVNFPGHGKAYAEYVASPESHLALIPESVSFIDAAATTLPALTALQALNGRVKAGDKVLIHAGSGGVGHFAVQIAKKLGAHVVSTSSVKNRDFVLSLGADEHIDYHSQAFEEVLSDMDLVFDTVGPEIAEKSLNVLRKDGELVSITIMGAEEKLQKTADALEVKITSMLVHSDGNDMSALKEMLAEGSIKPHVSKIFDFANLADAHTAIESGRTIGKIVVIV